MKKKKIQTYDIPWLNIFLSNKPKYLLHGSVPHHFAVKFLLRYD